MGKELCLCGFASVGLPFTSRDRPLGLVIRVGRCGEEQARVEETENFPELASIPVRITTSETATKLAAAAASALYSTILLPEAHKERGSWK